MESAAARSPDLSSPPRPRVVLSRCLEIEACRYNGRMIRSDPVRRLRDRVDFVPVCPEVEIGLGTPRDPIRMVAGDGIRLVQPSTGRDLTGAMTAFRSRFLDEVGPVDGFVLKSRSPSCGIGGVGVLAGPESEEAVARAPGLFAAAVLEHFPDHPLEDEVGLADPERLDRFLTRVFALAASRRAGPPPTRTEESS